MTRIPPFLSLLALAVPLVASAQPAGSVARGELLYSTHCNQCHTQQMHWRDRKLATDWGSLIAQVRRWQANTGRTWDRGDTASIACYLNAGFYRFPGGGVVCDE